MTLTGQQIDDLLEQQFRPGEVTTRGILQVSRGFSYTWDGEQPVGSRVDIAGITINGVAMALMLPTELRRTAFWLMAAVDLVCSRREPTEPVA